MTDVTGFGLLGHLYEMSANNFTIKIEFENVPFLKEAINQAAMGIIPAGSYNNQMFLEGKVKFEKELSFEEQMILFDAQTSGGLLISISQEKAEKVLKRMENEGINAKAIATVKEFREFPLVVK
jgi:selenide,water dikinase